MKFFGFLITLVIAATAQAQSDKLVIYSAYDGERLAPILAPFTKQTGITVEVVDGSSTDLLKKLETEGNESSADLYLDKDLVYLGAANQKGLLQSYSSSSIDSKIPSHLISNDRNWFLVFYRARTVIYNTNLVNPEEIKTFAELGDKKWAGKLCVRTSQNSYNEGLAAYLVKHFGFSKAVSVMESWVANFAVEPLKGDRDVIAAVGNGTCAIGIANTYYLAPIIRDDASFPVRSIFVEQDGVGNHINGVGIGITKSAKNVKGANLFLEFLTHKQAQEAIAGGFSQYPSSREAEMAPVLRNMFGAFVEDTTNINEVSTFVNEGKEAMVKAGYK